MILQYKHYQLYQESIKGFVYSVKLKLELNILSKLVDLVHGNDTTRSMTLDVIDSNTIPGQAQVDVERESKIFSMSSSKDQNVLQYEDRQPRNVDIERMSPLSSHASMNRQRTSGRESDILYADFLRTMN